MTRLVRARTRAALSAAMCASLFGAPACSSSSVQPASEDRPVVKPSPSAQNHQAEEKPDMAERDRPKKKPRKPDTDRPAPPRSTVTFPTEYAGAGSLPAVHTMDDIDTHDDKQVRLAGEYIEIDVRKRPTTPRRYAGHVAILLSDGTRVYLLPIWDKDSLRPQSEIDRFKDEQVEVIGTVSSLTPDDPKGGATPTGPCMLHVDAIRAAK